MKLIPSVWRICTLVGIVVQSHAGFYDALGRQVLPPPRLLTEPISTSCSFVSVLFVLQSTYLAHAVQGQLCGYNNDMPRKFLDAVLRIANLLLPTFL